MWRQVREEDGLTGLRAEGQATLFQEYIETPAVDLELDALKVRAGEAGRRPQPAPAAYTHGEQGVRVPCTYGVYKLFVGDLRFKHHCVTLLNHVQHRHAVANTSCRGRVSSIGDAGRRRRARVGPASPGCLALSPP